ncbi:cupredoxin domain-containing protein [Cohnella ginsengisoli]|uniref:Cupredoxin domain-containing protein n=1 Tax=Cohnella ginsengisoli TaxID=425004 RepID=A0A9X4QMC2_9BACL|nr:cupredoxin domain-containing protein [Cohnella ginsengisoli]MDG0791583.1 cupredoxin domain-containing protein [Cohnella ginsengisoli]
MLSACGKNNEDNNAASSPPATASASASASGGAAGGSTQEITVHAKNFEFDKKEIKLHVGDTVKLTLENTDGVHGLEVPDFNVNIKNGETATFTVDKAGTYDFNCSVQCGSGHDNMVGQIIVE